MFWPLDKENVWSVKNMILMYIISDVHPLIILVIFIFFLSNIWWLPGSSFRFFANDSVIKTIAN